jgi:hypothetical protein
VTPDLLRHLASQLDVLPAIVDGIAPAALARRPSPSQWSAHEHLAHLARYQEVFLTARVRRILDEEGPELGRYRAEEDEGWPAWQRLSTGEVLDRLRRSRGEFAALAGSLTEAQWDRVGHHPLFGAMPLRRWVEFFLIHEAHHLYMALVRSR